MAYGTFRDVKTHFREVVGSRRLGITEKTGYTTQAIYYMAPVIISSFIPPLLRALLLSYSYFVTSFAVSIHLFLSTFIPELSSLQANLIVKARLFKEVWHRFFTTLYLYSTPSLRLFSLMMILHGLSRGEGALAKLHVGRDSRHARHTMTKPIPDTPHYYLLTSL